MSNINAGNLQKGQYIIHHHEIWVLQKTNFYSPGKGAALMRTTMKNITTGKVLSFTFKSNEQVELADIETSNMQYLYQDSSSLYFMDPKSFEQYQLNKNIVGKVADYFKEGDSITTLLHNGEIINIKPPQKIKLKVVESEEAIKGNTVNAPKKPVKLETGVYTQAPLFIKVGDVISVDPETGEYLERVGRK